MKVGQMVQTTVGLTAVLSADHWVATKVVRLAVKTADCLVVLTVAKMAER